MGISIDAILCYGFRIKDAEGYEEGVTIDWLRQERGEEDEGGQMDFDDFLAKLSGLKEPDGGFDEGRYATDPEYKKSWSDYWAKKNKLEDEVGVELVWHCSGDQPMYVLAVKASVQTAWWGEPIELGQSIAAREEWREKLRVFCERAKIQFEEPQFILCSYKG